MSQKLIVLRGHGGWEPKTDDGAYTALPGNCDINFYTIAHVNLLETTGKLLDKGLIDGVPIAQSSSQFQHVPNMILTCINTQEPELDIKKWVRVRYIGEGATKCPVDKRNIIFTNDTTKPMHLKKIFNFLQPALVGKPVLFVWAACRPTAMKETYLLVPNVITRKRMNDFIDVWNVCGKDVPLPLATKFQVQNWVGRRMTLTQFEKEVNIEHYIKKSANPEDARDAWLAMVDQLGFDANSPNTLYTEFTHLRARRKGWFKSDTLVVPERHVRVHKK